MNSNLVDYKASNTKTNTQIITAPTSEGKLDDKINNIKTTTQSQINIDNTMNTIDIVNLDKYVNNSNTKETSNNNEESNKDYNWFNYAQAYLGNNVEGFINKFLDLGEGVIDTHAYAAQLASNVAVWIYDKALLYDYQNGYIKEETYEKLKSHHNKNWATNFIATDYSKDFTDWFWGEDEISKLTDKGKGLGEIAGGILGYKALSSVPYVGAVLTSFAGGGVATEKAYQTEAKIVESGGEMRDWLVFLKTGTGAAEGLAAGNIIGSKKLDWSNGKSLLNQLFRDSEGKINISSILNGTKTGAIESVKFKNIWNILKNGFKSMGKDINFYFDAGSSTGNIITSIIDGEITGQIVPSKGGIHMGNTATNVMSNAIKQNVVKEVGEEIVENIIN